jgi:hypothetical protein
MRAEYFVASSLVKLFEDTTKTFSPFFVCIIIARAFMKFLLNI